MAHILIVDDDASVLETLSVLVRTDGHQVESVSSGEEALEKLKGNNSFDLMITDLRMPGINGIELLGHIQECRPGLGVVVVSAYLNETTSRKVSDLGCKAYVSKPFKVDEVLEAVHMALADELGDKEPI